jgi:putative chitinase
MNITLELLKSIAGKTTKSTSEVAKYLEKYADDYQINTPLRLAHFLAQAIHESGGFFYMFELWGPTAAQKRYEGRKDLGNVVTGDGYKYRGRGIFQLTGRANYAQMSKILQMNLIDNPDLVASPEVAVLTALEYWDSRGLNKVADTDDVLKVTKIINGGTNGLEDRKKYLAIAKRVLEVTKSEPKPEPVKVVPKEIDYMKIQLALIKKGYRISADGKNGPQTVTAVKMFQK